MIRLRPLSSPSHRNPAKTILRRSPSVSAFQLVANDMPAFGNGPSSSSERKRKSGELSPKTTILIKLSQVRFAFLISPASVDMSAIENLLLNCGQISIQAVVDGRRVHPGNAYKYSVSREQLSEAGFAETMTSGATLVFVECGADPLPEGSIRVDHHRPGDPGYGRPPAEYWEASSIGQIFQLIAALGGDLSNPLTRCSGVR